ncbi:hypothetical protein MNEG_6284 [Monoraphidium neglectum]|uniref:Uncharacterized protein n=1 Tax=Monoraphidium neglectum TaxID=145388 RepID=A0A0D2MMC1_9CHLO|nr:hypothetical protein MNEG_6284 [Monoraphidium neglectum]KIZ01677.1 hypothetical protein MNEG_6284 [Monoraphidium neglectum]|eukprot:XP_013900696.1 hypothetical protein MNEG_6284 [Monoraphidium neglectum]
MAAAAAAEESVDDVHGGAGHDSAGSGGAPLQAELEQKVLALLQERRTLEASHARDLAARDAEVARLQLCLDSEVSALRRRQEEVEARAPLVAVQLAEARAALLSGDLDVSDEAAGRLRVAAQEGRLGLADAVRFALHQGMQDARRDNERLRLTGSAAREAAARLEAECARLRRDNARLAAAEAERQSDAGAAVSALEVRCQRLSVELDEAAAAVEVLRAKGRAYDEVEARAERLEAELERLRPLEASAAALAARLREAEAAARSAAAAGVAAVTERGYLSRELQAANDRVLRLEADLVARDEKVWGGGA